jgi:hypothetical protein
MCGVCVWRVDCRLFGDRFTVLRPGILEYANQAGYAIGGVDWRGLSTADIPTVATVFQSDLTNVGKYRAVHFK